MQLPDAPGDPLRQAWSLRGIDPDALTTDHRGTLVGTLHRGSPEMEARRLLLPPLCGGPWKDEIRVERPLGEGGNAIVSLATQASLHRQVAVKELKNDAPGAARALVHEGYVLGALEHPNIVPVHLIGQDERGRPMVVLKRVEGRTWRELLGDGEPLQAPPEAGDPLLYHLGILMQICNAVVYAHARGVIHRDIKPDNVMIGAYGEVYLMDWGLAVSLDAPGKLALPSVHDIGDIEGTPEYMAPEMAAAEACSIGPATDVYLLGACLHELLAGQPPHHGATLAEMLRHAFVSETPRYAAEVPAALGAIAARAMQADPAARYATVEALRDALAEFLRHRHAAALAVEASARAEVLLARLGEGAVADPVAVYHLFGEVRFGVRQALREWDDNPVALDTRRRALERMVRWELARESPEAAALLLLDVPEGDVRDELQGRLEALRAELASRERQVDHLTRLGREADVEVGRRERRRVSGALAGGLALLFLGLGLGRHLHLWRVGWEALVAIHVGYAVALAVGVVRARAVLWQNRVNRRFVRVFALTAAVLVVYWPLAWHGGVPFDFAVALSLLIYLLVIFSITQMIDARLGWASAPCGVAFVVAALFPGWSLELVGLALLGTVAVLLHLWKRIGNYAAPTDPP